MHWYFDVLKKYAVLSGRASRKEYWMFFLFNVIIGFVLGVIDIAAALTDGGFGLLSGLYALAVLLPGLAVTVRRLQDTDHSGWWLLILLVPLIGLIVFLVFTIRDGTPSHNRFGPNPKEQLTTANAYGMAAGGRQSKSHAQRPASDVIFA
jgi:uncharacterized membrane protein YhaH (DUF805 family)